MYLGSLLRNRCRARRIRDRPSVFYHKRENRFHLLPLLCDRCCLSHRLDGDVAGPKLGRPKRKKKQVSLERSVL